MASSTAGSHSHTHDSGGSGGGSGSSAQTTNVKLCERDFVDLMFKRILKSEYEWNEKSVRVQCIEVDRAAGSGGGGGGGGEEEGTKGEETKEGEEIIPEDTHQISRTSYTNI